MVVGNGKGVGDEVVVDVGVLVGLDVAVLVAIAVGIGANVTQPAVLMPRISNSVMKKTGVDFDVISFVSFCILLDV